MAVVAATCDKGIATSTDGGATWAYWSVPEDLSGCQQPGVSEGTVVLACPSYAAGTAHPAASLLVVVDVGSRKRNQPAPPHVVFDALTEPERDPQRPWLLLLDDEQAPRVVTSHKPDLVVWSSLFAKRPDAVIRFDLPPGGGGTDLRWALSVDEPAPEDELIGHMRKRVNQLINANLRFTFGQ